MKTYLRIIAYAKGLGWYIPQYVITALLYALFSVVNIALLAPMLEVLFGQTAAVVAPDQLPEFSLTLSYFIDVFNFYFIENLNRGGQLGALKFVAAALVITALLSNLFRYIASILLAIIRTRMIQNVRNDVFASVTRLDISFFTTERKGDIMSRITNDVQQIE